MKIESMVSKFLNENVLDQVIHYIGRRLIAHMVMLLGLVAAISFFTYGLFTGLTDLIGAQWAATIMGLLFLGLTAGIYNVVMGGREPKSSEAPKDRGREILVEAIEKHPLAATIIALFCGFFVDDLPSFLRNRFEDVVEEAVDRKEIKPREAVE